MGMSYLYFMFYWAQDEHKTWAVKNIFRNKYVCKVFLFFGFSHKWNFFENPPTSNANLYCELLLKNGDSIIINVYNGFGSRNKFKFFNKWNSNPYLVKLIENIRSYSQPDFLSRKNLGFFIKNNYESELNIEIEKIIMYEQIFSIRSWNNKDNLRDKRLFKNTIYPMAKDRSKVN